MEKKFKHARITTDDTVRGFGYMRMRDSGVYLHTLTLFIFIICWSTKVRQGKRQIGKWFTGNCIEFGYNHYNIGYACNIDTLNCIYYRTNDNKIVKATKYEYIDTSKWIVFDELIAKWTVIESIDVYIFNPYNKIEGYIKDNTFYVLKESIG